MGFFFPIRKHFCEHITEWQKIYDSKEPHNAKFPVPMNEKLNELQKIIILRCLRPDKVKRQMCSVWNPVNLPLTKKPWELKAQHKEYSQ